MFFIFYRTLVKTCQSKEKNAKILCFYSIIIEKRCVSKKKVVILSAEKSIKYES